MFKKISEKGSLNNEVDIFFMDDPLEVNILEVYRLDSEKEGMVKTQEIDLYKMKKMNFDNNYDNMIIEGGT